MNNVLAGDDRIFVSRFFQIFAVSMVLRILAAYFGPLGVDESYAISVAREFSWSFFDHSPISFWAPVFAAEIIGVESPLVFRIPTLVFGAVTTMAIFAIGREIGSAKAAFYGAVLYMTAPAFFLSGFFANPDGALNAGSTVCVYWLVRITKVDGTAPLRFWIYAALALAFALGSKYQAAFFPIAAFLFMVSSPVGRRWFGTAGPYVAAPLALIGLLPVLIWNFQNDWASLSFHTSRTGQGVQLLNFSAMIVGQMLYLSAPALIVGALATVNSLRSRMPERQIVAAAALVPVLAFNSLYLMSEFSLAHWTMPGWLFAMPLAGVWLAETSESIRKRSKKWLIGFGVVNAILFGALVVHFNTGILTRYTHETPPIWDDTSEAFDYTELPVLLHDAGALDGVDMIATSNWIKAGLMSTAMQGRYPVRILGPSKHHFLFMTGETMAGTALFLEPFVLQSRNGGRRALQKARKFDPNAQALEPMVFDRGGREYLKVFAIRMEIAE